MQPEEGQQVELLKFAVVARELLFEAHDLLYWGYDPNSSGLTTIALCEKIRNLLEFDAV